MVILGILGVAAACGGPLRPGLADAMPMIDFSDVPFCKELPPVLPPAWRRASRPSASADSMVRLVVEVRQPSGTTLARSLARSDSGAAASVDSTGAAVLRLRPNQETVDVLAIGYERARVPLSLRPGFVDTVAVSMRPFCVEGEPLRSGAG